MGIEFDPVNKWIKITEPTTEVGALDIYSAAMDWADEPENMAYSPPMKAVGKFDMGGGVYSDSIFMLQDGWKIKFWSGNYQAVIRGTLLPEPGQPRTVPPDTGNVEVVFQVCAQGIIIPNVAEWTQEEKNRIFAKVDAVKTKTDNLPPDPASESTAQNINVDLEKHDTDVKGPTWTDESLKKIKEAIDKIGVLRLAPKFRV